MHLSDLTLSHYRNYHHQQIQLSENVNVFCGENGQGKTNALEAIGLLAIGKSHRTSRDKDLIAWEEERASVDGVVQALHGERHLRLEFSQAGRKAFVNRVQQTKMTDFVGHFQVVLFAPEDLQLVKGGPKERRRFIDVELGQTQPLYLHHLANYGRTLQQRNKILKSGVFDDGYLASFDDQLALYGAHVISRRLRFLAKLQPVAQQIYMDISNGREAFDFQYTSTVPRVHLEMPVEEIAEQFARSLSDRRQSDMRMGYTSVGPHRDDLQLFLNGQDVQSFASQGQQRTIALSLRLAEIDFIYREIGEYPVLLLDDVLSELDDKRQRNLVLSMSQKVQTIITTTSLFHLEDELAAGARLFDVSSGIITGGNV
jgi:DNA replication and repair protein RecF